MRVRFVLLRLLGLVYFVAFLVAARQLVPLVGDHGLEPASLLLARVRSISSSSAEAWWNAPTLFWLVGTSDLALRALSWTGAAGSLALLLGAENALLNLALWVLYFSIVSIGQTFYGFGWEMQLLETGTLAVVACPVRTIRPMASAPPIAAIWLFRWLAFRVFLGAGLIKIRGDECWRDLTCLMSHYETQPNPSPLSWVFHAMPPWFQKCGVLFNHLVELVAPMFAFGPRPARLAAGTLFVVFQCILIASGNLSFLNWLTIVPALACFDDRALAWLVPRRLAERFSVLSRSTESVASRPHSVAAWSWLAVVAFLSLGPIDNLLSAHQSMNASFDHLFLVNTYGAFGTVEKQRFELVIEGTDAATIDDETRWRPYELPCKPGDVRRAPCLVTPYHHRLDWQMWFSAMSRPTDEPYLVHLVAKLLEGEPSVRSLFARDPFPTEPPRFVRADLYRYEMTRPFDGSGAWWRRTRVGPWLPPLSRHDPRLEAFLEEQGWDDR